MTNQPISSTNLIAYRQPGQTTRRAAKRSNAPSALAMAITKAASKQTYYTIRFLVDRERVTDAYRAYAYFRWVDDSLDARGGTQEERAAFLERQQMLVDACYAGIWLREVSGEERLLIDLIRSNPQPESGLRAYIGHMMAVMRFDTLRRGRLISQQELNEYTYHLAAAVTEALHYFIGHDQFAPKGEARYLAVTGAHITHMLRDTFDDVAAGYFNAPREMLQADGINAWDVTSDAYRTWVKARVTLARESFAAGREHLARVKCLRCRVAGYMYMARFEGVLDSIEREEYALRESYPERKSLRGLAKMAWSAAVNLVGKKND